jgi:curved DNA-binding protein CbpA
MNHQSPSKRQRPTNSQSQEHQSEPNLSSSNPYEILGLSPCATQQQIKISYRKLALQYHPDKLSPDASREEREGAHEKFTKIGHAYEILGDEVRRGEFDAEVRREEGRSQRQQRSHRDVFGGMGFGDSMFDDPFFSSFGGMCRSRTHRSAFDQFHFMDPFELFNQFFSDEMDHMQERQRSNRSRSSERMDPFFGEPFSGFGGSMMARQFDMMNSMMSQMHDNHFGEQMISSGGFRFSSSSSGGGQSVSTSTRTTIVNGVRTTVTERTVRHPDGMVERHVETTEGNARHALPSSNGNGARPALRYGDERRRRR